MIKLVRKRVTPMCLVLQFKSHKITMPWLALVPKLLLFRYTLTCGETAECKVPSSVVHGPIVQTLDFKGQHRLVVALLQSVVLFLRSGEFPCSAFTTCTRDSALGCLKSNGLVDFPFARRANLPLRVSRTHSSTEDPVGRRWEARSYACCLLV